MNGPHDHQRPAVKSQVKRYDEVMKPYMLFTCGRAITEADEQAIGLLPAPQIRPRPRSGRNPSGSARNPPSQTAIISR
jgi:hypothetical protein